MLVNEPLDARDFDSSSKRMFIQTKRRGRTELHDLSVVARRICVRNVIAQYVHRALASLQRRDADRAHDAAGQRPEDIVPRRDH